ncbi:MAG: class I lanthipeptide [Dinghuibacter sp.]|nr:class I lanthipeptide [Dinghuibacter sp.]
MKKVRSKLRLEKKTIISLNQEEKGKVNGGLTLSCLCETKRICPTPPISNTCTTDF